MLNDKPIKNPGIQPINRRGPQLDDADSPVPSNANHQSTPNLADATLPRWLTVDQVRKLERCRRERVLEAIHLGELACEKRGRVRYIRLSDVIAWEERRLKSREERISGLVHPDLADFA